MDTIQEAVENVLAIEPSCAEALPSSQSDSVFTVTVAQPMTGSTATSAGIEDGTMEIDLFWPSKRMNTSLAIRDGILFMYGGIYEEGEKQITLNDFYSLDIHKLDEWFVLVAEDRKLQVWQDSDSSDEEVGKNKEKGATAAKKEVVDDEDEDSDSDESMEITFDDAPARREGEGILDYFSRSQDYWLQKAKEIYEEDGETISERRLLRFAKEICEEACEK
uniref:DUF4110 domain-containing protein n=1 Tax=Arion vulgaris TaxID=1028688 RepID=A0A0B7A401_9EUPU